MGQVLFLWLREHMPKHSHKGTQDETLCVENDNKLFTDMAMTSTCEHCTMQLLAAELEVSRTYGH
jgi:hypothetical protein